MADSNYKWTPKVQHQESIGSEAEQQASAILQAVTKSKVTIYRQTNKEDATVKHLMFVTTYYGDDIYFYFTYRTTFSAEKNERMLIEDIKKWSSKLRPNIPIINGVPQIQ